MVAYYQALDSRFLLDDFYNLAGLEDIDVKGYSHFIFSGLAGPSGRPISMLSFALQHEQWPHGRFAFKLVNLIIHLLSGVWLYFITRFLSGHVGLARKYAGSLALITTFLWLIHPIQISAVLYAVQRMTLLSGFFTLSGILAYLLLWRSEAIYQSTKHLLIMSLLFGVSLICAVFSKENGILLPVLVLVVEFTILHGVRRPKIWKLWASVFLLLPVVLLLIYLAYGFDDAVAGYRTRLYTMEERLLTEARILFQYLYNIILPHPSAFSLFHDNYPYSSGLFVPFTTFLSVMGVIIVALSSLLYRRKWPVFSFTVLWFFGAHLLESTYLNLELYFEHRNYLAAYSVCFLIAWACLKTFGCIKNQAPGYFLVAAVMISAMIVSLIELDLWSKPVEHTLEWQRRSPVSPRAMEELSNLYLLHGNGEKALEVIHKIWEIHPYEFYPYAKEINIKGCLQKTEITDENWELFLNKARQAKFYGLATIAELDALMINIQKGKCGNINIFFLIKLVITLAHNPEYAPSSGMLHEMAAILSMRIGESDAALNNINRALELRPTATNYSTKIKLFLSLRRFHEAGVALDEFRQYLRANKRAYLASRGILLDLERRLAEMKSAAVMDVDVNE